MKASVNLQEVVQELHALANYYPTACPNPRDWEFYITTNLYKSRPTRRCYEHIQGHDNSADIAMLKTYQMLFDVPEGHWIESGNGVRWDFDPETEGWLKQAQQ